MNNFDYYNFRKKQITSKIKEEIEFYEKSGYSKISPIANYASYLELRITANNKNYFTYNQNFEKPDMIKMDTDEYFKYLDNLSFNKPWNKLREYHKIMKINQYIDGLNYGKINENKIIANKNEIKEKLIQGIKDKKFLKNKNTIEYDKEKMTITFISCLFFMKKEGIYKIKWNN